MFGAVATIQVGAETLPAIFVVHTNFLNTIPFFKAALSPQYSFKEAATATIEMPEVDPGVFEYFIQWLYTHDAASTPDRSLAHPALEAKNPAFFHLIKLHKLAVFLQCEELRNDCLDVIGVVADKMNAVPGSEDVRDCWEMEEESEGLRGLILDLFYEKKVETLIMENDTEWYVPSSLENFPSSSSFLGSFALRHHWENRSKFSFLGFLLGSGPPSKLTRSPNSTGTLSLCVNLSSSSRRNRLCLVSLPSSRGRTLRLCAPIITNIASLPNALCGSLLFRSKWNQ